jgi:hypothetical protein
MEYVLCSALRLLKPRQLEGIAAFRRRCMELQCRRVIQQRAVLCWSQDLSGRLIAVDVLEAEAGVLFQPSADAS